MHISTTVAGFSHGHGWYSINFLIPVLFHMSGHICMTMELWPHDDSKVYVFSLKIWMIYLSKLGRSCLLTWQLETRWLTHVKFIDTDKWYVDTCKQVTCCPKWGAEFGCDLTVNFIWMCLPLHASKSSLPLGPILVHVDKI